MEVTLIEYKRGVEGEDTSDVTYITGLFFAHTYSKSLLTYLNN